MKTQKLNQILFIISFVILILLAIHGVIDQCNNNIINISSNGFNLQAIMGIITLILTLIVMIITSYRLIEESNK